MELNSHPRAVGGHNRLNLASAGSLNIEHLHPSRKISTGCLNIEHLFHRTCTPQQKTARQGAAEVRGRQLRGGLVAGGVEDVALGSPGPHAGAGEGQRPGANRRSLPGRRFSSQNETL